MKRIAFFIVALAISLSVNAQSYDKLWKEYYENTDNLLPESAGQTLNKIEKKALKDKNDVQLLKTVIKRCEILAMTAEEPQDTIPGLCKSYLSKLSKASQVILNVEIAKYSYKYDDILTYQDDEFIKTVSMKDYAEVFQSGQETNDIDIAYEPTLYDYVMHCLIKHYDDTIKQELYDKLLAFDLENNYIKAYYNNRINQLGSIYSKEDFEKFSQLALECTDNEFIAKIKVKQIYYLIIIRDYVRAKSLCDETMTYLDKKDPLYQQCVDLNNSLTKKSIEIQLYSVYIPNQAIAVGLTYRNTTNPSYKIYKVSANEFLRLSQLDEDQVYKNLLSKQALVENTIDIPEETDYKEHSSLIALPALQNGQYFVVFSNNSSFKDYDDLIFSAFQVSNLSFFNVETDENVNIYTVNRDTGAPMSDVVAHFSERHYSYKTCKFERTAIGDVSSDKDGFLTAPSGDRNAFFVDLYYDNDTLISTALVDFYRRHRNNDIVTKTSIFTDRAIYRPGQTVQFSCVVYRGNSDEKEVFPNYETVVELRDPNNQVVDTLPVKTDEFGSASGSFTIPSDRISGSYRIVEKNGSTSFRVEKYKRPTFEVTFNTPEQEYKIGDSVTVSGKVAALSGFGLDNVKYRYTVTRKTTFPCRFWDWTPHFIGDETISSGESVTLNDGSFDIEFQLVPSSNVNIIKAPRYIYEINVEATNKQGETQSGTYSVSATYNKYFIAISTDKSTIEIKDFKHLDVTATNINGKPVKTRIEYKISKINDNDIYARHLGDFDRQLLSDQQLKEYFPNFDYYYKDNITKNVVYHEVVDLNGKAKLFAKNIGLSPAKYVVEIRSLDDTLSTFSSEYIIFGIQSKKMPYKSMYWTHIDKTDAQPGETINYYIGSSEKNVSALVMVKRDKTILKSERITLNNNIYKFSYNVREEDRGQLDFQVALIKYNTEMRHIDYVTIPYNNWDLDIVMHTERDKILPGGSDTWNVTVKDYKGKPLNASLIATMYDAALDNFVMLNWPSNTKPSMNSSSFIMSDKSYNIKSASQYYYVSPIYYEDKPMFSNINLIPYPYQYYFNKNSRINSMYYCMDEIRARVSNEESEDAAENQAETAQNQPAKIRKDFNETAFFYPDLRTDKNGDVSFTFTMPDALTRWNLKLLAYTKDLKTGKFEKTIVTQQPLMIMADMPRFAYDEDTLWIAANVINLSDETLSPTAKLEIFDENNNPIELMLSDQNINISKIPSGRSQSVRWKVAMQKDINPLTFKFSAITDGFSDAEQHLLPVLSTKVEVIKTMATVFWTDRTEMTLNSMYEPITMNFTTNPTWQAVQALPYIQEGDEKCATSAFYRYFVNAMSQYIVQSNPKIKEMFENTDDYDNLSELQKYEDLKAILLQETPWVLEAKSEEEQRANVAKLFDTEAINNNLESALDLLAKKQTVNGGWSWIDGMPESEYITQYILEGLGKLDIYIPNTGEKQAQITENAFHFIENEVVKKYESLDSKKKRNDYHCDYILVKDLLAMSYFPNYSTSEKYEEAKAFFLEKLSKDWKTFNFFNFDERACIALIFSRNGMKDLANLLLLSLRECSYPQKLYPNSEMGWSVYRRKITVKEESQILLAFNEIDPVTEEIDAMRRWLLKQKRTTKWDNEIGTVEAIYALMKTGNTFIDDNGSITLTINGENIKLDNRPFVQLNLTSPETDYPNGQIKVIVDNQSNHPFWGGFFTKEYWPIDIMQNFSAGMMQNYDENLNMKINREFIIPENVKVGDKVTVKITFENSQDMEFVYLKDLRGACFEPKEQLSEYHYDNGLWYYQSTSDVAMEFFIEYLPKGKHTLSYDVYVTKEGSFSAGYSHIQCQYAPEFGAYSNGSRITVK